MADFAAKCRRVLGNPKMLAAYARWCGGKVLSEGPGVRTAQGAVLRRFTNFSEFWTVAELLLPSDAERRLIEQWVVPGSINLDVGANVGTFSLTMAESCPEAFVHAFEPIPHTFARLQSNVQRNRLANVFCHPLAVGDFEGEIAFTVNTKSAGTNRMDIGEERQGDSRVTATVTTVDRFCEQHGVEQIAFAKIDVEGVEAKVLRGAAGILARQRIGCMLIEICPPNLRQVGSSVQELHEQIAPHGYGFFELAADGTAGRALGVEELESVVYINVLIARIA